MAEQIVVTVVFAPAPGIEHVISVTVPRGATLQAAIDASGLRKQYPRFDFDGARAGLWGKLAGAATPIGAGARIEIYRPLVVDPKVARARRAAVKKNGSPSAVKATTKQANKRATT